MIRVEATDREALFLAEPDLAAQYRKARRQTNLHPSPILLSALTLRCRRTVSSRRDRGFYRSLFPDLRICDPSADY